MLSQMLSDMFFNILTSVSENLILKIILTFILLISLFLRIFLNNDHLLAKDRALIAMIYFLICAPMIILCDFTMRINNIISILFVIIMILGIALLIIVSIRIVYKNDLNIIPSLIINLYLLFAIMLLGTSTISYLIEGVLSNPEEMPNRLIEVLECIFTIVFQLIILAIILIIYYFVANDSNSYKKNTIDSSDDSRYSSKGTVSCGGSTYQIESQFYDTLILDDGTILKKVNYDEYGIGALYYDDMGNQYSEYTTKL